VGDFALESDAAGTDLVIRDDDLASDDGLRTAVLLSLFTDRRAEEDDPLPSEDGDRRGWWADELAAVEGDRFGSRLWLLERSKRQEDVAPRAEEYAREALAWMLEDSVASKIDVVATVAGEALELSVTIHRPVGDPASFRFSHTWDAEAANAV
jgi:phage gp46-like protein